MAYFELIKYTHSFGISNGNILEKIDHVIMGPQHTCDEGWVEVGWEGVVFHEGEFQEAVTYHHVKVFSIRGPLTFLCLFFIHIFLKLIVTCRLYVIYVREDNDSNVYVMIAWLLWTIWIQIPTVPRRLLNLTHLGCDKMAAMSHTTFLGAFSWMKIFEF